MGASTKTLFRLADLKNAGLIGSGTNMLELGAQNLHCGGGVNDLRDFLQNFTGAVPSVADEELAALAHGGIMGRVMKLCGVQYRAIDIFEYEATTLFDLNSDEVPQELRGKFDLVTNFGTTEHVLDQHRSMRVIHDFTKPGGLIYHDLPMGGYFYHGYFSYTPLFFIHIAAANDYEIIFRHFSKVPANSDYQHQAGEELANNGWPDTGFHDVGIEFIFRKIADAPFRLPVEVGTSHSVDKQFLAKNDANIVILNGAGEKR